MPSADAGRQQRGRELLLREQPMPAAAAATVA